MYALLLCSSHFGSAQVILAHTTMAASSSGTLEWQATHGGKRQRAAAKRELGDRRGRDGMIYSRLVEVLLDAWAYGELSAAKIQKIVAAARNDGLGSSHIPRAIRDEILGVATIGDEGRIPGNCNRDLMRRLHIDSTPTFETTEVSVPFQDQEENLRYADTEVVFPRDVLAQLACFYESEFSKTNLGRLSKFMNFGKRKMSTMIRSFTNIQRWEKPTTAGGLYR